MKKFLLVTLAISVFASSLFGFLATSVKAQSTGTTTNQYTWYNQPYNLWFDKVFDDSNPQEIFGERYTNAQVQWIVYSLISMLMSDKANLIRCVSTKDAALCAKAVDDVTYYQSPNAPSYASFPIEKQGFFKSIVSFYQQDRPLSGISYVSNKINKFSLIPTANAQQTTGFGFNQLGFIQYVWSRTRDISYFFFILAIIAFAFMIMFRIKISPQAVVTIQSALPKLVIGLILVTFSYAIAGLLIDLVYVVLGLIATVVSQAFPILPFDFLWAMFSGQNSIGILLIINFVLFGAALIVGILGWIISSVLILTGPLITVIFILVFIICLILLLVYLWNLLRLTWMLIKTTANILIAVIISPLQIVFGLITPSGSPWSFIRGLVANLAVFPVVAVLFVLSFIFLIQSFITSASLFINSNFALMMVNAILNLFGTTIQIPNLPFTGTVWNPPFISGSLMGVVFAGAALSLIMVAPKAGDMIKALLSGKEFGYGAAIGEAIHTPAQLGLGAAEWRVGKQIERVVQTSPAGQYAGAGWKFLQNMIQATRKNV